MGLNPHALEVQAPPSRAEIIGDTGEGKKSKAYFAFQSLWTQVRGGWKVKRTSSTDADLRANNQALIDGQEPNGNMMSLPIDVTVRVISR